MGERLRLLAALSLVLGCASACSAFLDPTDPTVKKFSTTEDDGFSRANESEYVWNRGASGSVRCKSNQEMAVMKFALSSLVGQTISEAELHVCAASASLLYAADVATICVPWNEGTMANSNAAIGNPCWLWRRFPGTNTPQSSDYWLPGASFSSATYDATKGYWVPNGQDFTYATYGNNGSLVSWAYPGDSSFTTYTASTAGGTKTIYRIRLDPDIVHALILDQYGLTLSDTRGYLLQNNTVYTRNQWGGSAGPWLYVKGTITDTAAPGAMTGFVAQPGDWNGQVLLSFAAPTDAGPKGRAFGYDVRYSTSVITAGNFSTATAVDRWRIPRPVAAGTTQKILVEGLTPGATYYFAMKAYDQAGNATAVVTTSLSLLAAQTVQPLASGAFMVPAASANVSAVPGVLRYWAVSDYTKVNPVCGNRMADGDYASPTANDGYRKGNAVWDATNNKVVLKASRNEVAAFQLILEKLAGSLTNMQVSVSNLTGAGTIAASPNIELSRSWYVPSGGVYYPEVCIPLASPFGTSFAIPNASNAITGQTNQAVWVDIYVPKAAPAGTYTGTITVTADQLAQPLTIGLQLAVRSWQLPDKPTFIVDLNGYGAPWSWAGTGQNGTATRLSYFQVAQKHRQVVDTVTHSHTLNNASNNYSARFNDLARAFALTGSGASINVSSWTAFDGNWGQFLDGTAFSAAQGYNGPGMNTPISMFFLPFFESYPLSSYWWYDQAGLGGAYWYTLWPGNNGNTLSPPVSFLTTAPNPATAYPLDYETGLKNVVKAFMEHAQAKGWHDTDFQYFHNNKAHYGTAANPHSQFWNLDEPSEGDCMQALGYFHKIWREGVNASTAPDVKCSYRIDTSDRTGMHRGVLDGRVNLWCCSGVNDYHNLLPNRQLQWTDEKWWYYGGGRDCTENELTNTQRFMQVWVWGVDGALPYWDCYQTTWKDSSNVTHYAWNEPQALCLLYSGQNVPGLGSLYYGALPSVRMKEMRRGQQDIEYLAYLANSGRGWNRPAVTRALQQRYADVGGLNYSGMNELRFFQMREDVAASIFPVGDINKDSYVNVGDLQSLVAAWGSTNTTTPPSGNWNLDADINSDGYVNVGDLQLLVASWGSQV